MKKCKILIVEDELIVRQAVRYILEGRQDIYEIIGEASNGQEACELLEDIKPDVVICDISMPIIDGLELSKRMRTKYPNVYIIILSGYADFDYVKTCFKYGVFEYILKPKLTPEGLYATLDKICLKLGIEPDTQNKNNFLKNILTCSEKAKLPKQYAKKYIASLGINLNKIIGYENEQEALYHEIIRDKISEFFSDCIFDYYISKDNILMCMLVCENDISDIFVNEVHALFIKLSDAVLGIKICYSLISANESDIIKNTLNVKECSKQQFFVTNKVDIFEGIDIKPQKIEIFKGYKEKIDFFEDSFEFLHTYICKATYHSGYDEEEFKKQVEHIIYTAFDVFCEDDFFDRNVDIDQFKIMKLISKVYSVDDLLKFVDQIFLMINDRSNHTKIASDTFIERILDFIKENYSEQLNLKQVAEKFHISYSYLSTLFSHNLGIGFNEYLNKIRIENAKQMLKSSEYTISEICEKSGYLDQSYFSKIFKKNTGFSPSSFRRDMM